MDKKLYYKKYRAKNLDAMRKSAREWARRNKKPYYWNEAKRETQRRYRVKHKEKIAIKRRKRYKERMATDINFRLGWLLRSRVMIAIKSQLGTKAYKTIELLGCSIDIARQHIEGQFKDGMTWKNHGKLWEIDHIKPVSSFDLTKKEQQKQAFNYNNLQPLIKNENRTKGSKILTG